MPSVVNSAAPLASLAPWRFHPDSPFAAHRFEQYFTRSQSRSHFFRHENTRPQHAHTFVGSPSRPPRPSVVFCFSPDFRRPITPRL